MFSLFLSLSFLLLVELHAQPVSRALRHTHPMSHCQLSILACLLGFDEGLKRQGTPGEIWDPVRVSSLAPLGFKWWSVILSSSLFSLNLINFPQTYSFILLVAQYVDVFVGAVPKRTYLCVCVRGHIRRNSWSLSNGWYVCFEWTDGRVENHVSDVTRSSACPNDLLPLTCPRTLCWHPSACRSMITFQMLEPGITRVRPHTSLHLSSLLICAHCSLKERRKSLIHLHVQANIYKYVNLIGCRYFKGLQRWMTPA